MYLCSQKRLDQFAGSMQTSLVIVSFHPSLFLHQQFSQGGLGLKGKNS